MARLAVILLFGAAFCLAASSCATQSASLNAYNDPGFHSKSISSLAIFPVRNARLSPGEAQEVNRRILAGIVAKNPSIKLLSAAEATRLLNEKSLASDWARFLDNYSTSGVPDSQALKKFGEALGVQAILQAEMVTVVQEDGAFGRQPGTTRVTVRATMLSLTDGKLLWEATKSSVEEWRTPHLVDISDSIFRRQLQEAERGLAIAGTSLRVRGIGSKVAARFTVPVNQTSPRFGRQNVNLIGPMVKRAGSLHIIQIERAIPVRLGSK